MILKSESCHPVRWMQILMKNTEALASERIDDFLQATAEIDFAGQGRRGVYAWVTATLVEQEYFTLRKKQRGKVRALLSKLSGLSMPQITRLIRRYHTDGELSVQHRSRQRFPVKYTVRDVELLIEVDRAHQQLSGPATRRIVEREWQIFGKREYANLAEISSSHLYNLRHSAGYRQRAAEFTKTKPSGIAIGERRRPNPQGVPGYVRIDTVHQGDWDGVKGVYHLNAIDEVTQWEVLGCIGRINEEQLLPVLEAILHQFPFRVLELHSDNGSEFVNHPLYQLLKKHTVEFTRSRPNNPLCQLRWQAQLQTAGPCQSDHRQATGGFRNRSGVRCRSSGANAGGDGPCGCRGRSHRERADGHGFPRSPSGAGRQGLEPGPARAFSKKGETTRHRCTDFRIILHWKRFPISGSFQDWIMLRAPEKLGPGARGQGRGAGGPGAGECGSPEPRLSGRAHRRLGHAVYGRRASGCIIDSL